MGVQEGIVYALVIVAALFTARRFAQQFTHGDESSACAKCELQKTISEKPKPEH